MGELDYRGLLVVISIFALIFSTIAWGNHWRDQAKAAQAKADKCAASVEGET